MQLLTAAPLLTIMALPQLPFNVIRDYPELAVWQEGVDAIVAGLEAEVAALSQPTAESAPGAAAAIGDAIAGGRSGLMTGTDKTKLDGIESGAEVNVNADWDAVSGDAEILNKPPLDDTFFVPSSVTKTTGGTETGTVAGVQTMLDGTEYEVAEVVGTPGFDIRFNFTGITVTPTHVIVRMLYQGTDNHDVTVDLWNYNTSAFVKVHQIQQGLQNAVRDIPVPVFTDFISGGEAIVRVIHNSNGNAAHTVHFDYVAVAGRA